MKRNGLSQGGHGEGQHRVPQQRDRQLPAQEDPKLRARDVQGRGPQSDGTEYTFTGTFAGCSSFIRDFSCRQSPISEVFLFADAVDAEQESPAFHHDGAVALSQRHAHEAVHPYNRAGACLRLR